MVQYLSNTDKMQTTPAVSQPIALTVVKIMDVKKDLEDSSSAGQHQATLAYRGTEVQPDGFLDEDFFYNWKRQETLTPIGRTKVLPKLARWASP